MPRAKVTGDRYADKGRSSTISAGISSPPPGGDGLPVAHPEASCSGDCLEALKRLAWFDEGWLRVVSHEQGAMMYFKFKFSRGDFGGNYVFFRCDDQDIGGALWGLLAKVRAVYAGTLRPTPDHYGGD